MFKCHLKMDPLHLTACNSMVYKDHKIELKFTSIIKYY